MAPVGDSSSKRRSRKYEWVWVSSTWTNSTKLTSEPSGTLLDTVVGSPVDGESGSVNGWSVLALISRNVGRLFRRATIPHKFVNHVKASARRPSSTIVPGVLSGWLAHYLYSKVAQKP